MRWWVGTLNVSTHPISLLLELIRFSKLLFVVFICRFTSYKHQLPTVAFIYTHTYNIYSKALYFYEYITHPIGLKLRPIIADPSTQNKTVLVFSLYMFLFAVNNHLFNPCSDFVVVVIFHINILLNCLKSF